MKTAIVTGANGFVGGSLVKKLISQNIRVVALARENKNLPVSDLLTFIPMELSNISSLKSVLNAGGYDLFFHLAWAGTSGSARSDTALQLQNAQWAVDCLRFAKDIGCKRFIGAGSIMEHETIAAAYEDENRPGLGYIYGSGKLVAHTMCKSVAANIGIDIIWAQITNTYGAGECSPRFINTTLRKILTNEPLEFTTATQNYDFVYIDDVADAFWKIGEKGKPFCEYIIGSGNARPLREFIVELRDTVSPEQELFFGNVPFTGINLPLDKFDCSKTERDTGFKAQIRFTDGVRKTMDWIKFAEKAD